MWLNAPHRLSDDELVASIANLTGRGRDATAALVAHLAELENRGLHLALGFRSLYGYCRAVLHLSEHESYNRMEAAGVARRFPVVLPMLAEGRLHLTAVSLLGPHLQDETRGRVAGAECCAFNTPIDSALGRSARRRPLRRKVHGDGGDVGEAARGAGVAEPRRSERRHRGGLRSGADGFARADPTAEPDRSRAPAPREHRGSGITNHPRLRRTRGVDERRRTMRVPRPDRAALRRTAVHRIPPREAVGGRRSGDHGEHRAPMPGAQRSRSRGLLRPDPRGEGNGYSFRNESAPGLTLRGPHERGDNATAIDGAPHGSTLSRTEPGTGRRLLLCGRTSPSLEDPNFARVRYRASRLRPTTNRCSCHTFGRSHWR